MTNQAKQSLTSLTGLRFVAAFIVVISHLSGLFGLPTVKVHIGAMAVSFFFVLSGFILTHVYRERLSFRNLLSFYVRRLARIWPLHLVCLLLSIFVLGFAFERPRGLVNAALMQSWSSDPTYIFSYNGVSWSISTELFFYLVFPIMLLGGQRQFWIKYVLVWGMVGSFIFYLQGMMSADPNFDATSIVHVNPFVRLTEFCTGMAIGFVYQNRTVIRKQLSVWLDTFLEVLSLALIVLQFLWFESLFIFAANASWGGTAVGQWINFSGTFAVFAFSIYVFARSNGLLAKILGSRLFVFLGEISFALYMIHFMTIIYFENRDWSASTEAPWLHAGLIVAIVLGLSVVLFKLIEIPARKGLVVLYEEGTKSFGGVTCKEWGLQFRSPVLWGAIVMIAASVYSFESSYTPLNLSDRARRIVNSTNYLIRDVYFGDNLRLLGFNSEANEDEVVLRLVWQKTGPVVRNRFAHFVDVDGKIVAQHPAETKLFQAAPLMEPFEETVRIPRANLGNVNSIGIGFYSSEINPETGESFGTIGADRGPRSMNNSRLDLVDSALLESLMSR